MLISCNKLKTHIKNSESIDWLSIWDKFTIRTAEVEGVTIKGDDLKDVVVAEIIECENHPKKEKYHILKVNNGKEIVDILCGAPNVRVGLKTAIVNVGGMVSGITIEEKKIAGVMSQGMLCSEVELGIGDDHTGIIEFPDDAVVGMDIKDYLPVEDIIVEIDNKSLTNRPDLWGHYGIAREIAAITNHELLPLEIEEVVNDKKDLDIKILDKDLCSRYCGLKIENIENNKTPFDIKIFLYYTGMRSISLIVDLTNYLMLELGQPMHAFDSRVVKKIEVSKGKDNTLFTTLDNETRKIKNDNLMIKNNNEYFAIAGVMGGLDSEIKDDTNSIVLESATFDATSVRKTATSLGLRTEASARYEKSLDPNMTDIAIKRYLKLLKDQNKDLVVASNLTDIYPKVLVPSVIKLNKDTLDKYLGFNMKSEEVIDILESLSFKVKENKTFYSVTVPTFRATKDVTLEADLIEEIARIYGYERFKIEPLKLDLTFKSLENSFEEVYKLKRLLASKWNLHEVHSYLWYKTNFLNKCNISKENTTLLGKKDDNILRDDLNLSLLEIVLENAKYYNDFGIFEVGTIINKDENRQMMSILLTDSIDNIEKSYMNAKKIVATLFKTLKNINIEFKSAKAKDYYNKEYCLDIIVKNNGIGQIKLFKNKIVPKKKIVIAIELNVDAYLKLDKEITTYTEISKYQNVNLDYSIILNNNEKYIKLEKLLKAFKNDLIKDFKLIDTYKHEKETTYTIRFALISFDKTLDQNDLQTFKDEFIKYIKANGLNIIE